MYFQKQQIYFIIICVCVCLSQNLPRTGRVTRSLVILEPCLGINTASVLFFVCVCVCVLSLLTTSFNLLFPLCGSGLHMWLLLKGHKQADLLVMTFYFYLRYLLPDQFVSGLYLSLQDFRTANRKINNGYLEILIYLHPA